MYQLIIFDWDGTLMDSAQKIANCIQASARDLGLNEPSDKDAKNIIGLGLLEAMAVLFPDSTTAALEKLVNRYRHHWLVTDQTSQALFPAVNEGLKELYETGALLAVATGKSRAGLGRAFEELGLEEYFVTSRCADETRSKPHPLMLEEILDFTSIQPDKAIMVGDTTYDMDMAGNAKIDALGAGYGVHTDDDLLASGAIEVMNSFVEVINWFGSGRAQPAFES